MREIKFRAYGKGGYFHCLQSIHFDKEIGISVLSTLDSMTLWGDDFILEQFTGLHDKNGKEIYEGDILSQGETRFIVKWDNKHAMYKCFFEDLSDNYCNLDDSYIHDLFEVIGNIHEATK